MLEIVYSSPSTVTFVSCVFVVPEGSTSVPPTILIADFPSTISISEPSVSITESDLIVIFVSASFKAIKVASKAISADSISFVSSITKVFSAAVILSPLRNSMILASYSNSILMVSILTPSAFVRIVIVNSSPAEVFKSVKLTLPVAA